MDLSKFFDRCQHDVIMARVARKVDDKLVLKLIGRYLRAGVIVEGVLQPTTEGTPQGGPASPLLANILLDDLDKELGRAVSNGRSYPISAYFLSSSTSRIQSGSRRRSRIATIVTNSP